MVSCESGQTLRVVGRWEQRQPCDESHTLRTRVPLDKGSDTQRDTTALDPAPTWTSRI